MDSLIQSFRFHLGRKEYDKLDGIWLELVDSAEPDDLFELVELTERYAPAGKAEAFLWLLADSLQERKQWDSRFEVLKRLVRLSAEEGRLAAELAANLRHSHGQAPELEKLLQKSGLSYGQPLKQSLAAMERYIHLLPGSWLYCADWGACRVEKLDFLLDRVTVRCAGLTEYNLTLDSAHRRLRPAARHGFFHRLHEDRHSLVRLAEEDPAQLILLYLRDTGEPAGAKELKSALSELVSEQAWDSFWNRARRSLDSHPHVALRTKPARAYQWSEERLHKTDEAGTQNVERRAQNAETGSPEKLAAMSDAEIIKAYGGLTNLTQRKRFLEALREGQPERWPKLLPRLFVLGRDDRLRTWLVKQTAAADRTNILLDAALNGYREHQDAFVWLAEYASAKRPDMAPGLVTRLVDLLESQTLRRRWPALKDSLVAHDYRLLRLTLETLAEPQARSLYARLCRLHSLEPFRQDEIRALFADRFPDLARTETEEAILSTAAGIERGKQELARLTNEEIPRSAEEIGRARAHGDLSENYEYKAAKEKQARLMQQVNRLRAELARARPIAGEVDCSRVSVGCKVRLEDRSGAVVEYAILGPWDSNPDRGIISYLAPLGQKLLGRKAGESVELDGQVLTIRDITAVPLT